MTHTETVRRRKRGDGVTKRERWRRTEREREWERERKRRRIRRRRQGKKTNARRENYIKYRKSKKIQSIEQERENARRSMPMLVVISLSRQESRSRSKLMEYLNRQKTLNRGILTLPSRSYSLSINEKKRRSVNSLFFISVEQLMSCWSLVIQRKRTTLLSLSFYSCCSDREEEKKTDPSIFSEWNDANFHAKIFLFFFENYVAWEKMGQIINKRRSMVCVFNGQSLSPTIHQRCQRREDGRVLKKAPTCLFHVSPSVSTHLTQ